jgi:amino acid adenylation domain-containing protein
MENFTTIERRSAAGPRRLSFPQERLFLLDQIMPGLSAYNVPTLFRINATLDDEQLRRAFDLIVERHQILRTRVALVDGVPMQEVAPHERFQLAVWDLRSEPLAGRRARADELLGELVRRPFSLSRDVLLRAALIHLDVDEDLLLVVFHHAGSDHAAGGILFAELDAAYRALAAGLEPELPELPIQYADFAEYQREQLDGELFEELIAYWLEALSGAPDRLELPTDHPRPSAQTYRGSWYEANFAASVAAPLRELARSEGVSMFMVLLGAFYTLLHRYTGADDVVVGTPVSGRYFEETAPLLGFFSNTLALRTDLSGDPTFTELLARVKASALGALAHQELPFEKLVEVVNPDRARSHSPIFQILFGYDVITSADRQLAGASVTQESIPGWESARFDLSMIVHDRPDGSLHAHVGFSTELFEPATIERLVANLGTLLAAAAVAPSTPISRLDLLSDAERELVVERWNDTAAPYDRRCLHELFAEQAARRPDAIAVESVAGRLTYAELDRRSSQLAHELIAAGAGAGRLVGICMERSHELVIALLAALKTGAAYVPIDPGYPPQRQEFMLNDARVPVLVCDEALVAGIDPRGALVVCPDRRADRERIASRPQAAPTVPADPDALAYVIYTSGSTGRPKGVQVSHRSVANLIAYMRSTPGMTEDDVLANLTTPAFDLSVPDWYLPLTTGARLVIVPREATLDGVELADWLARSGATFVQATPTTWQLLVDVGWNGSPSLKIVCGGEALPRALANQLLSRGQALWHMYGPTETTVWSAVHRLGPGEGPPPIGGPIANTTFHVVDRAGQPVPIGVPGELLIGGDGVAGGYRERPELTAEKFVTDPFGSGGRLYRTGDLLRWRDGGTLEFHGRIDQQVKLRGFRIELGEIESVLDSHPSVGASVAIVREDHPGDQRLVAYLVPATGVAPDFEDLRLLLRSKLPAFMIPSAFVSVDAFPVTANGKLDRAGLPAPDGARPDLRRSFAPPETPVQETLASVWREVLGVDRIGIDDDFFELGGHSLLAVKMLSRVQDSFGLDLGLGYVFDNSTIRELGQVIAERMLGDAADDELALLLAEVEASER